MSKLEWMYNRSTTVDPEEYLLGKAIDKNFEKQSSHNEVDKDILPTSLFANTSSGAQVDVFRKIKEDPLEQIKQKEIEMRKQLLKNPVKLRKLQNMLKAKEEKKKLKDNEKKKNEDLDALLLKKCMKLMQKHGAKSLDDLVTDSDSDEHRKRKKNRKKKVQSESSSDSEVDRSSSQKGLSKRSMKRSNASRGRRSRSKSSDDLSHRAKSRRSRERDDSHSPNKRKDRPKTKRRSSSSGSDDDRDHRKKGKNRDSSTDELITNLIAKYGVKMLMDVTKMNDDSGREEKKLKKHKHSKASRRDSSPEDERRSRPVERPEGPSQSKVKLRNSHSSDSDEGSQRGNPKQKLKRKDSHRTQEDRRRRRSPQSSVSEHDKSPEVERKYPSTAGRYVDYSSEEERKKASKRAYGLVLPRGIDPKQSSSKSRPEPEVKKKVEADSKPQFKRSKPTKLTEDEKEARLKEMMANAQWRDKERSTRVKRYKEEEKKELEQTKKYDDSFMRNELAKAASKSVEERIKSNINNLQRSKFSMNEHFARRT